MKNQGFVYLIECNGFYKIGWTQDVQQRMADLQVGNPFSINLRHLIPSTDPLFLEKQLHKRFSKGRISGEWFSLTPEDIEYLKSFQPDPLLFNRAPVFDIKDKKLPIDLPRLLQSIEKKWIQLALERNRRIMTRAARDLGLSFRQIRYLCQKYMIK